MASVSLNPDNPRYSARNLEFDPDAASLAISTIQALLDEHEPFRRRGYPRAGAFDRLAILAFHQAPGGRLLTRFWLPGPRTIHLKYLSVPGSLADLLTFEGPANCLVLVGVRRGPGQIKYGERNVEFAHVEQGLFLQALHTALCTQGIPNRIQGGLNLRALPILCPSDIEAYMGLVV